MQCIRRNGCSKEVLYQSAIHDGNATASLIGFITGMCIADENPGYEVYLQGGAGALSKGVNGTMILTLSDMVPYQYITFMSRNVLMPLSNESFFELPLNAAFVLNGEEGKAVYLVKISSWNYDPDTNVLSLGFNPLEFYEGGRLQEFVDMKQELSADKGGEALSSGLYLEIIRDTPENSGSEILEPCQVCGKEFILSSGACQHMKTDVRIAGCSIVSFE